MAQSNKQITYSVIILLLNDSLLYDINQLYIEAWTSVEVYTIKHHGCELIILKHPPNHFQNGNNIFNILLITILWENLL